MQELRRYGWQADAANDVANHDNTDTLVAAEWQQMSAISRNDEFDPGGQSGGDDMIIIGIVHYDAWHCLWDDEGHNVLVALEQ